MKRVLIAEDEESIVASIEFLMRQCGFETRVARDGEDAIAGVAAFRPDLVLLDIMLPGLSGFEVCRRIRRDPAMSGTRVLMLTAKGGRADEADGVAAGADDYLTKPFATRELVARARALLGVAAPMSTPEATVHIVDDDASIRELLSWLMKRNGFSARVYPDARSFLAAYKPGGPGCLLLDLNLPGMSGLELQQALKAQGVLLPVVFLSGRADIPKAVRAVREGAIDFIEKPFDYKQVVDLVSEALRRDRVACVERDRKRQLGERLAQLTQREREVLEFVVAGRMNREIAEALDISIKTVEAHRAKLMEKLEVGSVAELVQAVVAAG